VPEVVDRHRAQRARLALAGRQQHVHLARIGLRRDLERLGDQRVRRLAAGAEYGHDAVAGVALGDDSLRGAFEALGVGDGGAAELHHHGRSHDGSGG
jgi:hypothetical protein